MRFANLILGVMGAGLVAVAGCSGNTGAGAGGSSTSTSAAHSSGSSSGAGACAPTSKCKVADTECLGLVDNTGKTQFGLRMSELDITAPPALATGTVANIVAGDVEPMNVACNLAGAGTFSWLLQFDTMAGTLKTGGATVTSSETAGYTFESAMITQGATTFDVSPITFSNVKPDPTTGAFSTANATVSNETLIVPIFISATNIVLLPLQQPRILAGTLSSSQNCIGKYNAAGLDPMANCLASGNQTEFIDAANVEGFITLAQADTVIISTLHQSLCAFLAGGTAATMYTTTDPATMNLLCTRNAGNIVFQGDWCAATNAASTTTCFDSVKLTAKFAASSVVIN